MNPRGAMGGRLPPKKVWGGIGGKTALFSLAFPPLPTLNSVSLGLCLEPHSIPNSTATGLAWGTSLGVGPGAPWPPLAGGGEYTLERHRGE